MHKLQNAQSLLKWSTLIGCVCHPTLRCLSTVILCLDAHFNIQIRWIPGITASALCTLPCEHALCQIMTWSDSNILTDMWKFTASVPHIWFLNEEWAKRALKHSPRADGILVPWPQDSVYNNLISTDASCRRTSRPARQSTGLESLRDSPPSTIKQTKSINISLEGKPPSFRIWAK